MSLNPDQFSVHITNDDGEFIDAIVLDSSPNRLRREFAVTIPHGGEPEGWLMRSQYSHSEFHECARLPKKLLAIFVPLIMEARA